MSIFVMENSFDFDWSQEKSLNFLDTEGTSEVLTLSESPPTSRTTDPAFDYRKHIMRELSNINVNAMDPLAKKKLVQKIRNRISAQRSRERSKNLLERLQEENFFLKDELAKSRAEVDSLKEEVSSLKRKLQTPIFEDSSPEYLLPEPVRRVYRDHLSSPTFNRSFFIALVCVVSLLCVSFGPATSAGPSNVKLSATFPALATTLTPSSRQLSTIKETCNLYCKDLISPSCDEQRIEKTTEKQPKTALISSSDTKLAQMYCQETPHFDSKTIILFHNAEISAKDVAFFAPSLHLLSMPRVSLPFSQPKTKK